MGGNLKWKADVAITTLLSTELNGLGNNTGTALGTTAYDNSTNLNFYGDFELAVTFALAATVDSTVDLYIIPATDGTNYNDGSNVIQPSNFYRGSWTMRAATAHRLTIQGVLLPPVPFKLIVYNNATGQPFPANGSTVKMLGYQEQYT